MALHVGQLLKHQLESVWKEAIMVWSIILPFAWRVWLNNKNLGIAGFEWRLQLVIFWIWIRSVTAWAHMIVKVLWNFVWCTWICVLVVYALLLFLVYGWCTECMVRWMHVLSSVVETQNLNDPFLKELSLYVSELLSHSILFLVCKLVSTYSLEHWGNLVIWKVANIYWAIILFLDLRA